MRLDPQHLGENCASEPRLGGRCRIRILFDHAPSPAGTPPFNRAMFHVKHSFAICLTRNFSAARGSREQGVDLPPCHVGRKSAAMAKSRARNRLCRRRRETPPGLSSLAGTETAREIVTALDVRPRSRARRAPAGQVGRRGAAGITRCGPGSPSFDRTSDGRRHPRGYPAPR